MNEHPTSIDRPLFRLIPNLATLVQPLRLLQLPSPITEEKELSKIWSLASLHVKRDDLVSNVYGGSKTRMIEYFLGRAQAQKRDSIASMGPYVSHQLLGIGVFANKLGYECYGVLAPQPDNPEIAKYGKLYAEAGIRTIRCQRYLDIPLAYIKTRFRGFPKRKPFWIPPGGNDPYGIVAIVDAALELAQQIESGLMPMPQDIVVPTGTCATAAGLYLGISMLQLPIRIVAVRTVPMTWTSSAKLKRTAKKGLKLLRQAGYSEPIKWGELLWVNDQAHPGYGLINDDAKQSMDDVEQHGDFRTEITYTGKTLGLFQGPLLRGRRVIYWNTYSSIDPNFSS